MRSFSLPELAATAWMLSFLTNPNLLRFGILGLGSSRIVKLVFWPAIKSSSILEEGKNDRTE